MSADSATCLTPLQEAPIHSIQPGGGWGMALELAWGRFRRWWLRCFFPGYVQTMLQRRQGQCEHCPGRARGCRQDVIDARDLKYYRNVCGYDFHPEDDPFRRRNLWGFARPGLGELVTFSLLFATVLTILSVGWIFGLPWWLAVPLQIVFVLLWAEIVWFFRDPERKITAEPTALVSPADGTVTDVGEVVDAEFPGGKAFRIGIFLSVFNVHVNRSPRAGKVTRLRYFPGKFMNALNMDCAVVNEQLWIDMEDRALGIPIRVKQIAGAIARRIVCTLKVGETIGMGERIGMIKLGSRTELYLPTSIQVNVAVRVGQPVKGGSTILLHFKETGNLPSPSGQK